MEKYYWEKGVEKESLPSTLNWGVSMGILIAIYAFLVWMISYSDPIYVFSRVMEKTFFLWGAGIWFIYRMSIAGFRFSKAFEYLFWTFPRMRSSLEPFLPYHTVAIIYTGYSKTDTEIWNALCGMYKAAYRYGAKRTIVVMAMSKNEKGESEFALLQEVLDYMSARAESRHERDFYQRIIAHAFAQDGSGKRAAITKILEFLIPFDVDVAYLMDGDSIPEELAFVKAIPFFQNNPEIGSITLNNFCYTQGGDFYNLYSILRFVRRIVDIAYSPTVNTGRGSFIRGSILQSSLAFDILDSHFINWGGEQVRAVTGDDKTMVYLVWSLGYKSLFVPDVSLYAMEEPLPKEALSGIWTKVLSSLGLYGFFAPFLSILAQESRYTRNMQLVGKALWEVRPNDLATTMKLFDQRFFFWAAIVGPISAAVASYTFHPMIFVFWLLSSLTIKVGITLLQGIAYGYWHPMMPIVTFLNVIQGFVKIFSFWNIKQGRWSREGQKMEEPNDYFRPALQVIFTVVVIATLMQI